MKRQLMGLLVGITLLLFGSNVTVQADVSESPYPTQTTKPSEELSAESANNDKSTELVIKKNVVKIKDKAYFDRKDITLVVIESGVIQIGNRAFDGCANLEFVYIPKTVTKIGKKAFNRCPKVMVLMESGINKSVIDEVYLQELQYRVGYTYNQNKTTIKKTTYKINYPQLGAYRSDDLLRYKIVKKNDDEREVIVKGISSDKPNKIKSIKIPNIVIFAKKIYRVVGIDKKAFKDTENLTKVTIGKNVNTIGTKAFYGCKKLRLVKIQSKKCLLSGKYVWGKNSRKLVIKVPKSVLKKMRKRLKKNGVQAKAIKAL